VFLVHQRTEHAPRFGFGLLEGSNKLIVEPDLTRTAVILDPQLTQPALAVHQLPLWGYLGLPSQEYCHAAETFW
jgi:hypothetical protein